MPIRNYRASDRDEAVAAFDDARAVDQSEHRIVTDGNGAFALWWPEAETAMLGPVINPGGNRADIYDLILAMASQMQAEGFARAAFRIFDERLMDRIRRDLTNVDVEVEGTLDGQPAVWLVTVGVADQIAQLTAVIGRLRGRP